MRGGLVKRRGTERESVRACARGGLVKRRETECVELELRD